MRTVLRVLAFAAILAGCSGSGATGPTPPGPPSPSPTVAAASSAPSAVPSSVAVASPSPTAAPTPASSATAVADATSFFTTLTLGWRPTSTTAVVREAMPAGQSVNTRVVAVPLDGGAAKALVDIRGDAFPLAVRRDGSALAVAVGGGIASWEPGGRTRWVAMPVPDTTVAGLAWSPDGSQLYFGRYDTTQANFMHPDLGIFRVRADGSSLERVIAPLAAQTPLVSAVSMVTTDGVLVWGHAYEGSSLELLDLATGRTRTYLGGLGAVSAWRPTQPRALIEHCGGTGGCRGLVEWNDETGTVQRLLADDVLVAGADREPGGARVVVSRHTSAWELALIDGSAITPVAGTSGAETPHWLPEGMVFSWGPEAGPGPTSPIPELRLVAPSGGTPRTLYRAASGSSYLFITQIVVP